MIDFKDKDDGEKVKLVESHYQYARNRRNKYEPLWEILSKIYLPRRAEFLRNEGHGEKGKQFGHNIYSGAPAMLANKCALGMLNYMASKSVPWLAFGASRQPLMKDDSVKQYYQDAGEQILWSFNKSNFFGSSVWFTKDGVVVGTAASVPEFDLRNDRVCYKTVHPGESYVEDDEYGSPGVYFRTLKRTAIQLYKMFGNRLPADVIACATGKKAGKSPFSDYDVLMAVYRVDDYDQESLLPEDGKNRVFYILRTGGKSDGERLLMDSGIPHFPIIWRMGKEPDCNYGTSIAADGLTAALIDNKLAEKGLLAVHKAVESPMWVHENLRGKLHLNPGGRTYFSDPSEQAQAIQERIDWPMSDAQQQRIQDILGDTFFVRFFELLSGQDLPQLTAYQVRQMLGEKAVLMSSITESFEEEYLRGAVETQWEYETLAGRMPDAPDILLDPEYGDGEVDVNFIGPLAQLQRSVLKSKGILDGLEIVAQIGQIWPNSLIKINEMELIEDALIAQGFPQDLIKSDEEVQAIIQAQQQKQEMMEAAEMAEKAGRASGGLGKAIEPNSPMDAMAEMVAG